MRRLASTANVLLVGGALAGLGVFGSCVLDADGTSTCLDGSCGAGGLGAGGTTSSGTGGTGGTTGTGGDGGVTVGGMGGSTGGNGGTGGTGGEGGSPPFSPLDIPNCVLWLRSDFGVVLDGSAVVEWQDQSTTQWHVAQPDPAHQPTFDTTGQLPTVRFAGAQELVTSGSPTVDALLGATAFDAYFVTEATAFYSGVVNVPRIYFMKDAFSYGTANPAVTFANEAALQLLHFRRETADVAVRRNAIEIARATPAVTSGFDTLLRIGRTPATSYMDGDLYEVILYSRQLSGGEVATLDSYVNSRYAIW